ncbi:UDP-Glycosyltransferase/glycogen phosphorylase [Gigaspora margarita]|uniref:UDP-Glycosyltransferase/glycogen phosphorylase n=1 Tax=Gigaspora margarita TaxID=4874 RepID=A0A8H3X930_GIGMA|nr:UDP-Glycosyltransferase/glycogen phosphorylase [Gigaspora margarita]
MYMAMRNELNAQIAKLISKLIGTQERIPFAMLPLHQEIGPILPDTYPNLTSALNSFPMLILEQCTLHLEFIQNIIDVMVVLLAAMNQFILQPDQFGNVEKLEMAGMALSLSKLNLTVDGIVLKIKRLLSEESFKKNAERLQFIAKMNSN